LIWIIFVLEYLYAIDSKNSFRIRELTSVVQKRFNFPENTVELYAEKVATRGLCAIAQVSITVL
jgi:hypothetical protein